MIIIKQVQVGNTSDVNGPLVVCVGVERKTKCDISNINNWRIEEKIMSRSTKTKETILDIFIMNWRSKVTKLIVYWNIRQIILLKLLTHCG